MTRRRTRTVAATARAASAITIITATSLVLYGDVGALVMESLPQDVHLGLEECHLAALLVYLIVQLQDDLLRLLRVQLVRVELRLQRRDELAVLRDVRLLRVLEART